VNAVLRCASSVDRIGTLGAATQMLTKISMAGQLIMEM